MRHYPFVGRKSFIPPANAMPPRFWVNSPAAVIDWILQTQPEAEWNGAYPATFVVDLEGNLWIADRRSEHVACARVQPVLAAGEIFFEQTKQTISVSQVTNQSTGYCPEPESWPAVSSALNAAGFAHPSGYDPEFIFRYCKACANICIIKEGDFTCPVCNDSLPEEWNF